MGIDNALRQAPSQRASRAFDIRTTFTSRRIDSKYQVIIVVIVLASRIVDPRLCMTEPPQLTYSRTCLCMYMV